MKRVCFKKAEHKDTMTVEACDACLHVALDRIESLQQELIELGFVLNERPDWRTLEDKTDRYKRWSVGRLQPLMDRIALSRGVPK